MDLNDIFRQFPQFRPVSSEEDIKSWKRLEEEIYPLPVYYQKEFIDYQEAYYKERTDEFETVLVIISSGNKDIGIWPLSFLHTNMQKEIGSLGGEIQKPLFENRSSLTVKTLRRFYKMALDFLICFAQCKGIEKLFFTEVVFNNVSLWHSLLMEYGAYFYKVTHDCICDLNLSEDEAKKRMHKSVKARISTGYKFYDYDVLTRDSPKIDEKMELFRKFHIRVSGRETRGIETWKLQSEGIKRNRNFAVFLYDRETGAMDGASLFTVTNSFCYYSVAVYDREKFDRPLGYVVQDVAMKMLRKMNVRWYDVGDRYYSSDGVDNKMIAISENKEAFSTEIHLKIHLKLDVRNKL